MKSGLRTVALCIAAALAAISCQTTGGKPQEEKPPAAGKPPASQSIAELRASLASSDVSVRIAAVDELGRRAASSPEALDAVVGALGDSSPLVRRFAAGGLAELPAPPAPALSALARLLRDSETEPRQSASRTLAALAPRAPPDSVPELAAALSNACADTEEAVRANALEALGGLGIRGVRASPAVRPALERGLTDWSDRVRAAAVEAVGKLGAGVPWSVGLLAKALSDPRHDVRKQAVVALEKIGPPAAPATRDIARLLHGKEIYLRVFAADALAAIGPGARAALPELREMEKKGWKDLEGSPEVEAQQLPGAVAKAIRAIEGGTPQPKKTGSR
jgi:HEAT repeat protein